MTLVSDWKHILRKAWSVRFIILAGLLSMCEALLWLFPDVIPPAPYAAAIFFVSIAALGSRIMAQKDFTSD